MKRLMALVLACLACMSTAWGAGVEISLHAQKSDVLPQGALRALNVVLSDVRLLLETEEDISSVTLMDGDSLLIGAQSGQDGAYLMTQSAAAILPPGVKFEGIPDLLPTIMQQLGAALTGWEKSGTASADFKGAGKPRTQLTYALSGEEWAAVWPGVCDILLPVIRECLPDADAYAQAESCLRSFTVSGKGTLRRYFAADGAEMGAYFYAAQVGSENDLREVRLEYGYVPEKGFYLAFRCPNANETRNVRISMQGKTTVQKARTTQTISADVRITHDEKADTCLLESTLRSENGHMTGKSVLNITRKRDGVTKKYAWTVQPDLTFDQSLPVGTAEILIEIDGKKWLTGEVQISAYAGDLPKPVPNEGSMQDATAQLPYDILKLLMRAERSDMQQLLHYLAQDNFLNGETTVLPLYERPDGR